MRILFVDDEPHLWHRWLEPLKRLGSVELITKPSAVFSYFENHGAPDVLLMDVMLPTPEGIAESATEDGLTTGVFLVTQLIRQIVSANTLVVFLTNVDFDTVEECINEAFLPRVYLKIVRKSIDPDSFSTDLKSWLVTLRRQVRRLD
jgi:CheY-like chemotaxis protein